MKKDGKSYCQVQREIIIYYYFSQMRMRMFSFFLSLNGSKWQCGARLFAFYLLIHRIYIYKVERFIAPGNVLRKTRTIFIHICLRQCSKNHHLNFKELTIIFCSTHFICAFSLQLLILPYETSTPKDISCLCNRLLLLLFLTITNVTFFARYTY